MSNGNLYQALNSNTLPKSPATAAASGSASASSADMLDVNIQSPLGPGISEQHISAAVRDRSPAARAGRLKAMFRAVIGELFATTLFFFMVCGVATQINRQNYAGGIDNICNILSNGLGAIAIIYCFADISGAHFNPAVTFAIWVAGKTSNRKCAFYILAQLIGSNMAMFALFLVFDCDPSLKLYTPLAIKPADNVSLGGVFAMEFILTFILVFVIFTLVFEDIDNEKKQTMTFRGIANSQGLTLYAPTPQHKSGFAPLAIGLTVGLLNAIGGTISGSCFNPARLFGPAIWSNTWDSQWIYWLAQFSGAAAAAAIKHSLTKFGLPADDQLPTHKPILIDHV